MTYLARYEAGEHEAVWVELRALGNRALEADILSDARQVADATMRRVRANLQRIEAGLHATGYAFLSSAPQPLSADEAISATRRAAEETVRNLGLDPATTAQLLASLDQTLGSAQLPCNSNDAPRESLRVSALGDPGLYVDQLDRFERMAGPAPLALGSFWRIVGWADFTGRSPTVDATRTLAQPLVVMPPAMLADDYEAHVEDNGSAAGFMIELVADAAETDLNPLAEVPMTSATDVRLPDGEWFVDYLRRATRAAAFPGLGPKLPQELAKIAMAWEPF
ncbi:hypothetical protein [Sphingomonas cavernae]|uniref:Uncharacterized protein n=1 Tax=Sphingomonas cavernae TaxID=2320861 RepID=A0A418WJL6_9SPHN|nr:hypothetical protein [Sphingomonas cavernae]RJF90214.1 hypothetical protein D3876_07970 [Sphingomonas cavernae]